MEAAAGQIVAPSTRSLDELAGQLQSWLARHMPGAADLRVRDLQYPVGAGQSHETILFDLFWTESGHARSRGLVVRIKPSPDKAVFLDDMFEEQYALMREVHRCGAVPVAEVLWLERDHALLGAPFFVMERKRGWVPVSFPPYTGSGWFFEATPAQRRTAWEDGLVNLGRVQQVPRQRVGFLDRTDGKLTGFDQEIDRWQRYLAWLLEEGPLPTHERVFADLLARAPQHRPAGLVWGDARIGNMMFGEDFRVIAVMDWEQPSLGGALHDLGWWLYNEHVMTTARGIPRLPGMGTRAEALAIWSETTGIPTNDIEWYEAFAAFKGECLRLHMASGSWVKQKTEEGSGIRFIMDKLGA